MASTPPDSMTYRAKLTDLSINTATCLSGWQIFEQANSTLKTDARGNSAHRLACALGVMKLVGKPVLLLFVSVASGTTGMEWI